MTINQFIEKAEIQKRTGAEIAFIKRAYEFAARAHGKQKRKSGEPYIVHPIATATRLLDMGLDTPTIAAALLHDTIEDTNCTKEDIAKLFGDDIAFMVEGITKLKKIKYKGSKRSAESLRKMFLAIAEDIRIVLLKLVDRLHNMETLRFVAPEKQKRIALETLEIYAPLAYRLGMGELSGRLEDLAFPYTHPQEYRWLMENTKERYEEWNRYVEETKPIIAEKLTAEKIPFTNIHARAKRYYSLYKKLLKYDMDLSKVLDIVAIRVIVPTVADCYATMGAVHKFWRPLPGKIKDYISLPKPNGYQSLHTTVFGPRGRLVEIQIRTPAMHEEAEHGIAAHHAYAEFKKERPNASEKERVFGMQKKRFAWIQQLRDWQKDFETPDEFLESLRIDYFKDRIFVVTPAGDVIDLPEGSTPVDFAYHVHSDIGNTAVGAKVNGNMRPLHYELRNGDVVEVITQKNKKPNQTWLSFVKSPIARKRITTFLKKEMELQHFTKRKREIVEIRVTTHDRTGMLRDVSNIFARQKMNIQNIDMESKNRAYPIIVIHIAPRSKTDLDKIMVRLKEIKGVEEVGYKLL